MDDTYLGELIRRKIKAGALPAIPPERIWAGTATERPCVACDELITHPQTEIALEISVGPGVRLHLQCFDVWRAKCGR